MNRDDELDDPFIARYADRVADDREVLWRADFARVLDYEDRGYEEDPTLLLAARQIRDRWATDPQVAQRWTELDEIHAAWIYAPEAMKQAHEVTMPGGLRPPDMDATRWASHMQAREMADHGAWPGHEPTYSTDSFERHEPMTNTTPAQHVLDSATESEIEQQMRTDYELAAQCYSRDPDEYDPADSIDYQEYASPWLNHEDPRYLDEWCNLGEAVELWRNDPDSAAAQLVDTSTAPLQRRHLEHGRNLARGIYTRDVDEVRYVSEADSTAPVPDPATVNPDFNWKTAGLTSSDASRNTADRPVPEFSGVAERTSALAAYSGNALADSMQRQAEHEGAER